jgi:ribosomal-protein-alanine N-acetyltransferase
MTTDPPVTVDLVLLSDDALQALVVGDLEGAGEAMGLVLPPAFGGDRWLWSLRLGQVVGDPDCAPWLVRAVVARPGGTVVGHAGFHGPPDEHGTVEVGYLIVGEQQRRGYATAALTALIAFAREHGARTIRAAIAPGNVASLALVAALGFRPAGEQDHARSGSLLVFERDLT